MQEAQQYYLLLHCNNNDWDDCTMVSSGHASTRRSYAALGRSRQHRLDPSWDLHEGHTVDMPLRSCN